MDWCRFIRHQAVIAASARAYRLFAVTCRTTFLPARDLPHTWVKPRKVNEAIRLRMVSPIWPVVAEINEARLNGMECESMPCKPLAQHAKDPLGIEEFLERHHGIISEADKGTSPLETWPHLTLKPFIQHMVQEDVRETR